MLEVQAHGGECCGVMHVFNFVLSPDEENKAELRNAIYQIQNHAPYWDDDDEEPTGKRAVEVCLTDTQLMSKEKGGLGWAPVLKELGFQLNARWKNPNSYNYVNQFLLVDNEIDDLPYEW